MQIGAPTAQGDRTAPTGTTRQPGQRRGELWDVLGKLPEDQRIVVVLKYYGGYRASEIASIVDMPGATVRSHLRRGLKALREELDS